MHGAVVGRAHRLGTAIQRLGDFSASQARKTKLDDLTIALGDLTKDLLHGVVPLPIEGLRFGRSPVILVIKRLVQWKFRATVAVRIDHHVMGDGKEPGTEWFVPQPVQPGVGIDEDL